MAIRPIVLSLSVDDFMTLGELVSEEIRRDPLAKLLPENTEAIDRIDSELARCQQTLADSGVLEAEWMTDH